MSLETQASESPRSLLNYSEGWLVVLDLCCAAIDSAGDVVAAPGTVTASCLLDFWLALLLSLSLLLMYTTDVLLRCAFGLTDAAPSR